MFSIAACVHSRYDEFGGVSMCVLETWRRLGVANFGKAISRMTRLVFSVKERVMQSAAVQLRKVAQATHPTNFWDHGFFA